MWGEMNRLCLSWRELLGHLQDVMNGMDCAAALRVGWSPVIPPDPQLAKNQVLAYFGQIEAYLLLGASILTCGVLTSLFMLLRRRIDRLLLWFSVFAGFYGLHLILDYQLLWWLGYRPEFFRRIVVALELLIPLPAFFFFSELDLLGRTGRLLAVIISPIAIGLALATITIGPEFRIPNHVLLTIVLVVFVIALLRSKADSEDAQLLRPGLLVFIACSLYDHITGIVGHFYHDVEPVGFLVLIVCLGIVAARRALAREQQLGLIQQELQIAQRIQRSILPATNLNSSFFRVAARYLPMSSVAGDFYDFIIPDDRHAGILVADVSGHGVPAALIASMVKLAATAQASNAERPAIFLHGMNVTLCGNTQNQFVTAAYAYLSADSATFRYAGAAHPAMFILRNGEVLQIVENGLMLGAFPFATYTEITQPLVIGDRLMLYTDGLLEATDERGEEFGGDRLAALLKETGGTDPIKAADLILERVQRWSPSQEDDLTVLICDYVPQI